MTEHTTNNNSEAEKATNNTPKNNVDKQTNNYPSDIQGLFDRLGI
ncbi:hypothetical protein [Lutibacter sp.]|nr:hypothetical protein [Lutibacter sp.]